MKDSVEFRRRRVRRLPRIEFARGFSTQGKDGDPRGNWDNQTSPKP